MLPATRCRIAETCGVWHPANMKPWIQTYSGRCALLLSPHPDMVSIDDIAVALSNQCRFLGHVRSFYSVAQHSVVVSRAVPNFLALAALLHDAAEAYVGDMPRPLKRHTECGSLFQRLEARWQTTIEYHFGLEEGLLDHEAIMIADCRALLAEKRDLLPAQSPHDWPELGVQPLDDTIVAVGPRVAHQMFMARFHELVPRAS